MDLIQPVKRGADLIAEMNATGVAPGQLAIWWLGQSGYAIKTPELMLYFDLYLSEHLTKKYATTEKPHIRMTEAPLRGADISNADYVFASHKHSDHLDPETLPEVMKASVESQLILPYAIVSHAVEKVGLPVDWLRPMTGEAGDQIAFGEPGAAVGLTVQAIPSAHPTFEYTEALGYPFLGFLVEANGARFYHSGDTVVSHGLVERLRAFDPHIVFLPINGTSERLNALGTPPNMSAADAVELALAIGNDPLVIPHHYDMFTFNTVDVREFTALADARGVRSRALQPGERFLYTVTADR